MSLCLTFGIYPKAAVHGRRESALIRHGVTDSSNAQDMGDRRQLAQERRGMPICAFVGADFLSRERFRRRISWKA
jgi:hypothetical protein